PTRSRSARDHPELSSGRGGRAFFARRCCRLRQGHVRRARQLSELLCGLALHPRYAWPRIRRMLRRLYDREVPSETELTGLAWAANSAMSPAMRARLATARTTTTTC